MSEAIRSSAAFVSGAKTDRGIRRAGRAAQDGLATQQRQLDMGAAHSRTYLTQAYDQSKALYQPYASFGIGSLQQAQDMIGTFQFDPSQITNNPAYNFRLDQGLEAVNRSYAARGGIGGGGRLTGIMDYAQGLASTEYENEYRRQYGEFGDTFNSRMGIAHLGYQATAQQAQATQNYYGGMTDVAMQRAGAQGGISAQMGDTRAATIMGRANNFAATNMYMGDQAAQGWDNYMGMVTGGGGKSGGGGSMKSGGAGVA